MLRLSAYGIVSLVLISLVGCSSGFDGAVRSLASEGPKQGLGGDGPEPDLPDDPQPVATPPPPSSTDPLLKICSRLDFTSVKWPQDVVGLERKAMALALNITGSFEGSAGWSNLAANFDGQGMSLGLNQQNLGQGTLQPLLIKFVKGNGSMSKVLFSTTNLKSMTTMLGAYSSTPITVSQIEMAKAVASDELFPDIQALTSSDEGYEKPLQAFDARTNESVAWARKTLYLSNGNFKTDWKNSFLSLAVTAPYRSLQIEAALSMFMKALGYFEAFKFKEMRSLLLMYDFVVQNGGFNSTHLSQYKSYVNANPNAAESARLNKLLEIRLKSVLSEYREDVRARKMTIITGTGRVHGASRNLTKEYCYVSAEKL